MEDTTKIIAGVVVAGALIAGGLALLPNDPTYFAEVAPDGTVLQVIVIDQETLDTGRWGDPAKWKQTDMEGKKTRNYAAQGMKYDPTLNAFIPPKLKDGLVLNTEKLEWEDPNPKLKDNATTTP